MYNATGALQKQDLWYLTSQMEKTNKLLEQVLAELQALNKSNPTKGGRANVE